ncbi:hypothetical protein AN958_02080 [Leucoagaricus sp. SymC.cos]|nr:hypothetical protein AN958_02080 [Leucoagaricus sp. SymC.cos]
MPLRAHRAHRRRPGVLPILLLLFLAQGTSCEGDTFNVDAIKIDDASGAGDFYTNPITSSTIPEGSLNSSIPRWTTQSCGTCSNKPDPQYLNNRTYTAIYLPPENPYSYNISFQFNGTSIEIYLILSNQAPTSCNFVVDGNSTSYTGTATDAYQYGERAFSLYGLELGMHETMITTEGTPDTANYLNFDYAIFTQPKILIAMSSFNNFTSADPDGAGTSPFPTMLSPSPSPTSSSPNSNLTIRAIAGGVIGGFLAIVVLIIVASFYRHRRLRELEETAHLFTTNPNSNVSRFLPASDEERRHFIPFPAPQSARHIPHRRASTSTYPTTRLSDVTPFTLQSNNPSTHTHSRHPPTIQFSILPQPEPDRREEIRQERQRELNRRLETATTQMRSLKTSYMQDQRRLQNQLQQQRAHELGHGYPGNNGDPNPAIIRIVPGGMPDPIERGLATPGLRQNTGEPMVTPAMLYDMRQQMQVMMDHIQFLRAQQNSPYAQGLTDEPPPGYVDVVASFRHSQLPQL